MGLSAAEQAEMQELQGGGGKSALSPDEHAEMAQLQKEVPPSGSGLADKAITGLRAGAKVLDYQRGAGAVGLDRIAQALGAHPGMTPQQGSAALDPTTAQVAPSYREMLKNWGAPAGPSSKDIPTRAGILGVIARHLPAITARDAVGTGMDMGLDPLTYEGGALEKIAASLKGVPVAGRAADAAASLPSAISDQVKEAAKGLYKSGIEPIVKAGKLGGNPGVADTMMKEGIWGGPSSIRQGMQESASGFKSTKDATLQAAEEAGAVASKDKAITPMFEQLQSMVKDQRITPDAASRILQDLTEAKQSGGDGVSPRLMDVWKTDERKMLPGSTYSEIATRSPPVGQQLRKALGSGYQKEVERSVGGALGPEAQDALQETNRDLGNLINPQVRNAATRSAVKSESSPWLTKGEIMTGLGLGGAGAAMGHTAGYTAEGGLGVLATLAALKAANAPATRTGVGLLADRLLNAPGVSPLLDAASRRGIVDPMRKSPYVVPAKEK